MKNIKNYRDDTKLAHLGRHPERHQGVVNDPVYRTSTIQYPSFAEYEARGMGAPGYRYGRLGTPASDAFNGAMTELEGGYGAFSYPSGLSAITSCLLSFLGAGDHLLMADTVYPPTRSFCDHTLRRFGVEVEYYNPMLGAEIEGHIRHNTRVIYMESPGSGTFEVQDVPGIVGAAKPHGVLTMIDNTWASPLLFNPIAHGVNVVIHSATKYIGGHSDISLGVAVADTEETYKVLKSGTWDLGACASGDDYYLALRGLRTMKVRLKQNGESALALAQWMQKRPEVAKVYYPPLPGHAGHEVWKRDFRGANGIFSFLLKPVPKKSVAAFADALKLFPVGSSWGGYESLLQPQHLAPCRTAVPWTEEGTLLRLQIGLEDPADLIADLENGFAALKAVA